MTTPNSDDRLDTLLEELGPAEPPAGFADSVLAKVARTSIEETQIHASSRVIPFSNGGIVMAITKKAMWGLAAAAAIVLAVFIARGGFPTVDRTEGAIGAAKKYQAPQLAANDVVTGDASVQEFLQSDTFDRLIKDPQAVSLLSNAAIRVSLSNKAFADALKNPAAREYMRNGVLSRIYSDAAARAALEDALKADLSRSAVHQAENRAQMTSADMQAALKRLDAHAELHPSMRADLKMALSDVNLRPSLESDAFRKQLEDSNIRAYLTRADMSAALFNRNFVDALNHNGFSAAVRSARFETAMSAH
jgi:hypothetical protein